jgi:hypothetical protein
MENARFITLEEARQVVRNFRSEVTRLEMLIHLEAYAEFVEEEISKIVLYEGNTTLPYLAVKDDIVIVSGNLTVTGILEDALETNVSLLMVEGNVTTQYLYTFSQICISGDCIVEKALVADSIRDSSLYVAGNFSAKLILEDGHWFNIQGTITADEIYTSHSAKPYGQLQRTLTDEDLIDALKVKDRLDLSNAMQRFKDNNLTVRK